MSVSYVWFGLRLEWSNRVSTSRRKVKLYKVVEKAVIKCGRRKKNAVLQDMMVPLGLCRVGGFIIAALLQCNHPVPGASFPIWLPAGAHFCLLFTWPWGLSRSVMVSLITKRGTHTLTLAHAKKCSFWQRSMKIPVYQVATWKTAAQNYLTSHWITRTDNSEEVSGLCFIDSCLPSQSTLNWCMK